ncbi:methyltransferase domain protein [mine drainage metagenome]|jgi:SAM-dependent methyltransferase|uniref:Methyltransferase domain protein n=1 Tax=mine drainage metagenome TaxID=410659 RepID=A0A1J5RCY5_9ZZZZ
MAATRPPEGHWVRRTAVAAAAPYRTSSRFAWHFARAKLKRDPVFAGMLRLGLISGSSRIADLGCGQGLLAAWMHAALARFDAGDWPPAWPAPPRDARWHGIELMPRDVARARAALGDKADIEQGDVRVAPLGTVDTVVILDVLHYFDSSAQDALLRRVYASLAPTGVLLLRVANAAAGWRFRFGNWVDRTAARLRGHRAPPVHCRALPDWLQALHALGFAAEAVPMSEGTPFANVLLVARKPALASSPHS